MKKKVKLISDFNIDLLYNYLNNNIDEKKYKIDKPNFEFFNSACYSTIKSFDNYHCIIIWNRIEGVIQSFSKLLNNEFNKKILKSIYREVHAYVNLIKKLSEKTDYLILTSWTIPYLETGHYLNDYTNEFGISKNINKINLLISEKLRKISNIFFLNIDFLMQRNFEPISRKLWYATKIPYNNKIFEIASKEFTHIIYSFSYSEKKLLALDLDNTLWGGEVGELGWENINLGGHNYVGEAFQDFQKKILAIKKSGVQLAIISKNEEQVAIEAFKKNKEMILKLEDFAAWRINWEDKAKNLNEIVNELNLSLDSCVFLDDSLSERNRIKTTFPQVLVPDLPDDPSNYVSILQNLRCFNKSIYTNEDKLRTKYYKEDKDRQKIKTKFKSQNEWLKSLKMKATIEDVNKNNKTRVLQLINKTNQMNLKTRRLTEKQLNSDINNKNIQFKAIRLTDKFGDMGLIGLFSINLSRTKIDVLDFILSCRAFGRSIENLMFYYISLLAKKKKLHKIFFKYVKTNKNKPCLNFLNSLKLKKNKNIYEYNFSYKVKKPNYF